MTPDPELLAELHNLRRWLHDVYKERHEHYMEQHEYVPYSYTAVDAWSALVAEVLAAPRAHAEDLPTLLEQGRKLCAAVAPEAFASAFPAIARDLATPTTPTPVEPTAPRERVVLDRLRQARGAYVTEEALNAALVAGGFEAGPRQAIANLTKKRRWNITSAKSDPHPPTGAKGWKLG